MQPTSVTTEQKPKSKACGSQVRGSLRLFSPSLKATQPLFCKTPLCLAILLLLTVIFNHCFLWRNLFNHFAFRLLFSPLRYSPINARAAAFLADTPLCTISSLCPNLLLPRTYTLAAPRFDLFCRLYSLRQCRGAHFPALSFHVEQRLCRPPKP